MTTKLSARSSGRVHLTRRPICIALALALVGAGSQADAADRSNYPVRSPGGAGIQAVLAKAGSQPDSRLGRMLAQPRAARAIQRLERRASGERGTWPRIVVENCNDSGPGSLRAALADLPGAGVIDMTALTCSRITLTSGALNLPHHTYGMYVDIAGPGRDRLTIDGNHQAPVFSGAKYSTLFLSGVTVANGRNTGSQVAAGGCIAMASGELYLFDSRVRDCQVEGDGYAVGGGISAHWMLSKYSDISGNSVSGNGVARGGWHPCQVPGGRGLVDDFRQQRAAAIAGAGPGPVHGRWRRWRRGNGSASELVGDRQHGACAIR